MASSKYWNEATAAEAVTGWRASGLSMAEYARQQGMHLARLYRWRRRVEGQPAGPAQFRPVRVVAASAGSTSFEVILADPVRVRVPADFDAAALARLVGALSRC